MAATSPTLLIFPPGSPIPYAKAQRPRAPGDMAKAPSEGVPLLVPWAPPPYHPPGSRQSAFTLLGGL